MPEDKPSAEMAPETEAFIKWLHGRRSDFNMDRLARFAASLDSAGYLGQHMVDVPRFKNRRQLLTAAAGMAALPGLVLEFGVFSGKSIRILADLFTGPVYGFDSFQGLPEEWVGPGSHGRHQKGHFATDPPAVPGNVELIAGWFNETLPGFMQSHPGDIQLLHVDCDLYSSTRTIFESCADRIKPGTVIVFDEYLNYANWREHEYKAFQEFIQESGRKYAYTGVIPNGQQVSVVITE
jgi:hypothetical protein